MSFEWIASTEAFIWVEAYNMLHIKPDQNLKIVETDFVADINFMSKLQYFRPLANSPGSP